MEVLLARTKPMIGFSRSTVVKDVMNDTSHMSTDPVRSRLIKSALDCFLADEYRNVTTRQIAAKAETSFAMIHYYFGSKEGLYEEMIRETMAPLLDQLDGPMFSSTEGFADLLRLYYRTVSARPEFPKLILKILALNQEPGKQFVLQLIERGRTRGRHRIEELKARGAITPSINPEVLRLAFVSLAMTPMLLKDIFEEQWGHAMDSDFLEALADFNGRIFAAGIEPAVKDERKYHGPSEEYRCSTSLCPTTEVFRLVTGTPQ